MNFTRLFGLACGAVLLASCAPQWVNRDRPGSDYNKDRAACGRQESEREKRGSGRLQYGADPTSDSFSPSWSAGELEETCMRNRGCRPLEPVDGRRQ